MTRPIVATPLLEVKGLTAAFAAHDAVRGVSFKLEAGESSASSAKAAQASR